MTEKDDHYLNHVRIGTLDLLRQNGWAPWGSNHSFLHWERTFGAVEFLEKPLHVPRALRAGQSNVAIPASLTETLKATLKRTNLSIIEGSAHCWEALITFSDSRGRTDVPIWLRRQNGPWLEHELIEQASQQMTSLETAMRLGWRP